MKPGKELEPFRAAVEALNRLFERYNDRGVIIGGVAVSLLGQPRYTADVDAVFLLSTQEIPNFLEHARSENLTPRIPNAEEFAKKNRVLLLRHSTSEIDVDISLGMLPFEEEMIGRGSVKSFAGISARLPTPEDLIVMKAVARRPKDVEDIRTIVEKHPDLDKSRIEFWVKNFAELLEMPELWGEIEKILTRQE